MTIFRYGNTPPEEICVPLTTTWQRVCDAMSAISTEFRIRRSKDKGWEQFLATNPCQNCSLNYCGRDRADCPNLCYEYDHEIVAVPATKNSTMNEAVVVLMILIIWVTLGALLIMGVSNWAMAQFPWGLTVNPVVNM